jgi:hypothetical protein
MLPFDLVLYYTCKLSNCGGMYMLLGQLYHGNVLHSVWFWHVQTGQCLKESDKEQGHQKTITSLSKSADWSHFLTGSLDKSAKVIFC